MVHFCGLAVGLASQLIFLAGQWVSRAGWSVSGARLSVSRVGWSASGTRQSMSGTRQSVSETAKSLSGAGSRPLGQRVDLLSWAVKILLLYNKFYIIQIDFCGQAVGCLASQ